MITTLRNIVDNNQNGKILSFNQKDFNLTHYQRLIGYINELVRVNATRDDDGWHLDFDDLNDEEQGQLIALQLEENDRDTTECFYQPDRYSQEDEITCALLNLLKNNSNLNCEQFATAVRKQSINRFKHQLQDLIDDRCGWEYQEWKDNKGFYE